MFWNNAKIVIICSDRKLNWQHVYRCLQDSKWSLIEKNCTASRAILPGPDVSRLIVMARPRFPGRPGCRYERISVRYLEEESRTQTDPNFGLVLSFRCGLKQFRELVGESDEVRSINYSCYPQNGRHRTVYQSRLERNLSFKPSLSIVDL